MPHGETFWNPYRMVPVRPEVIRTAPVTDEKFTGQSGVIHCTLENLTLLFVGENRTQKAQFLARDRRSVIPGSSLKGALRSLAELVGGGCMVTGGRAKVPNSHKACNLAKQLCITCRMFGMMERGKGARVHKGQVSCGDALVREETPRTRQCEILLSNPEPHHTPFYLNPTTGNADGLCRKMYFHQPQRTDSVWEIPSAVRRLMQAHIKPVFALLPGHHFDFEVTFTNLRPEELRLLLYVMALEREVTVEIGEERLDLQGPLRHKIGMGKPLGMGSCNLTINRVVYLPDPAARFTSMKAGGGQTLEGNDLQAEIDRMTAAIGGDTSLTMLHLRKMMVWDDRDPRDFHYPSYDWFKNPENSGVGLKRI